MKQPLKTYCPAARYHRIVSYKIKKVVFFVIQALSQNAELRTRLSRIHSESVLGEQVVSVNIISTPNEVRLSLMKLISDFLFYRNSR